MPIYDACPDPECQAKAAGRSSIDEASPREQHTGLSGQLPGRTSPTVVFNPYYTGRPRTPVNGTKQASINRQEIIRKIKSREDRSRPTSPELERPPSSGSTRRVRPSTPLQAPGDRPARQIRPVSRGQELENERLGMQIERPRSALHRGDFREKEESTSGFERFNNVPSQDQPPSVSTSPVAPWHPAFPASAFRQAWDERRQLQPPPAYPVQRSVKSRAASHASWASTFIYQAPTSPLVHQSRPDTPPPHARRSSRSPDKQHRRHTFSPQALQQFASALDYPASTRGSQTQIKPTLRKETTYPYQAHQPRRSLHSITFPGTAAHSSPSPAISPRRPSISSDAHSPLHLAPMVGSYEESILRGRMSTTPSKPLNFIAQIGVLGKGACKPNLKCPPHITVPFPAVFYSYGPGARPGVAGNDQPSPYVGLVDFDHIICNPESAPDKQRQRFEERLHTALSDEGSRANSRTRDDGSSGADAVQARRLRRRQKAMRRSRSPKMPPGGCYRIPQQGQLQIVIKNPNKTAVKLFLVPYDLSDMEPGQKTFIRQRSYSAGPIIDMPMSSRKNLGTDRPEASLSTSEDPNDRPMLRYLIHLHICCTGRGRYWLYKSVRVVFANRVPDGKEKLRNEIQLPEPRYSAYKPSREPNASPSSPNLMQRVSDELGEAHTGSLTPVPKGQRNLARSMPSSAFANDNTHSGVSPLHFPYQSAFTPTPASPAFSRQDNDTMEIDSQRTRSESGCPLSPASFSEIAEGPESGFSSPLSPARRYQEPFVFGRDRSVDRATGNGRGAGESILSQKLKGLGM